jgi:hypothetical protein
MYKRFDQKLNKIGDEFDIRECDDQDDSEIIFGGTIYDLDAKDKPLIWLLRKEVGFVIVWITVTLCLMLSLTFIYMMHTGDSIPFKCFLDFIVSVIKALKS